MTEQESPLEHIVQHPLVERPASVGLLTPDGKITVFSDQIAMIAAPVHPAHQDHGLPILLCAKLATHMRPLQTP